MSDLPIKRGEVKGGTLYEIVPSPGSPPRRDYILIDKDGKAHALLRDEARKLMASLKPDGKSDPAVARFVKSYETALARFNSGEKGLRELDEKMAGALKGSGGAPQGYEPGPQEPPRSNKVSASERLLALARGDAELPISNVDASKTRTPKAVTPRAGGLGVAKDADPKQTHYERVWTQLDEAMLEPKKQDLGPLFHKLNEAKEKAGISDEQFQHKAISKIHQWMLSIGNSIQYARVQEASDEYNRGPIARPTGGDAYAGVAKLKAAIFALDPTGHYTEADIRDTASPGWQRVVVALNQQFEETLGKLTLLQPSKGKVGKEVALGAAEILYAEAKSLASYAPDRKEAMTRAKEVYDQTLARIGE